MITDSGTTSSTANKRDEKRSLEATAFIEVASPVMVSPAGLHLRPRRVRLQVSRVPRVRHTVVLFVQSVDLLCTIHRRPAFHNGLANCRRYNHRARTSIFYFPCRSGLCLLSARRALCTRPPARPPFQFPHRPSQLP